MVGSCPIIACWYPGELPVNRCTPSLCWSCCIEAICYVTFGLPRQDMFHYRGTTFRYISTKGPNLYFVTPNLSPAQRTMLFPPSRAREESPPYGHHPRGIGVFIHLRPSANQAGTGTFWGLQDEKLVKRTKQLRPLINKVRDLYFRDTRPNPNIRPWDTTAPSLSTPTGIGHPGSIHSPPGTSPP